MFAFAACCLPLNTVLCARGAGRAISVTPLTVLLLVEGGLFAWDEIQIVKCTCYQVLLEECFIEQLIMNTSDVNINFSDNISYWQSFRLNFE